MTEAPAHWFGYGFGNPSLNTSVPILSPQPQASLAYQASNNFFNQAPVPMWQNIPTYNYPITIDQALRQYCHIPVRHCFLAMVLDDGRTQFHASPAALVDDKRSRKHIFDEWRFRQLVDHHLAGPQFSASYSNPYCGDLSTTSNAQPACPSSLPQFQETALSSPVCQLESITHLASNATTTSSFSDGTLTTREITPNPPPRPSLLSEITAAAVATGCHKSFQWTLSSPPSTMPAVAVTMGMSISSSGVPVRTILLRPDDDIQAHYAMILAKMQQTACRILAKTWVKLLRSAKRSSHSMTKKGECVAPEWWPRPWGSRSDQRIRHKSPHRLLKLERIHLLVHILGLAVLPCREQPPGIRHLNLSVQKVASAAHEALERGFAEAMPPVDDLNGEDAEDSDADVGGGCGGDGSIYGKENKKAWFGALIRLAQLEENEILRMREKGIVVRESDDMVIKGEKMANRQREMNLHYEVPDVQLSRRGKVRRNEAENNRQEDYNGDNSSQGRRKRRRCGYTAPSMEDMLSPGDSYSEAAGGIIDGARQDVETELTPEAYFLSHSLDRNEIYQKLN